MTEPTKPTKPTKPARPAPRTRKGAPDAALAAVYDAVWRAEPLPEETRWTARPWVAPSDRAAEGRTARDRVPRPSHAAFTPRPGRDPIAILAAQEADRLQELVPLRHERMAASPFAYYRGTPAVMAFDLADTPRCGILVQASGDAHIANFGLFASPERTLVFDANDFDETLTGPWEWDVKRLATSVVIASRENGYSSAPQTRQATLETVRTYRQWMARYATMRLVDIWYATITDGVDPRGGGVRRAAPGTVRQGPAGAPRGPLQQGTPARRDARVRVAHRRRGRSPGDPRRSAGHHARRARRAGAGSLEKVFTEYRASMAENKRDFLERYRFVDWALKVVGVGSVGTRCFIFVLEGRDENDPLIMQAKEATASVLEPHLGASLHPHHGQRVVVGQQLMQAVSDIFLGWTTGPGGRDFYIRQLWDMKGSVDIAALEASGMGFYGGICAWSLARAHANTGDGVAISAYLGTSDRFDGAIADFAEAYADVNERDHRAYVAAIEAGRISVPKDATAG